MHIIEVLGQEPLFYWGEMAAAPTEEAFVELATQMTGRVLDMVIAIRQLLDWAKVQAEIDGSQIGVVGFSLAAIVAAIVLGVDDRFAAGVLMMGAAKPGEVLATCNGHPGKVRKAILDRFDWSRDRYQALFQELFTVGDPVGLTGRYRPERLLIIDSAFDNCMSRGARQALWEATGRPERIRYLGRHKSAFLALTPIMLNMAGKKIHAFMDQTLAGAHELPTCTSTSSC